MEQGENIFTSNADYISQYLKWVDVRIKHVYEIKENGKNKKDPYDGAIAYNILNDTMYTELEKKTELSLNYGVELNLEKLCKIFKLNKAEKIFVLLSLSVELHPWYGKIYGYFNDNINKIRPSINFASEFLGLNNFGRNKIRESFYDDSLFKKYILHYSFGSGDVPLFFNELRIDERIINYVLEINSTDSDIKDAVCVVNEKTEVDIDEEKSVYNKLDKLIDKENPQTCCICLYGEKGTGKKENIKYLCKTKNINGIIVNLKLLVGNADDFKINIRKSIREAIISEGILAFDGYDEISHIENSNLKKHLENIFYDEADKFDKTIFLLSCEKIKIDSSYKKSIVEIELKKPDYKQRVKIWNYYLNKYSVIMENVNDCAAKFNFTPSQIKNTVLTYRFKTEMSEGVNKIDGKLIYESCFEQVNHNLYKRASKVNLNYSWEQLILPEDQKSLLLDACHQVENKYKVYDEWGFDETVAYGKGVTIICSGPPGTGKTMSAQVLASKLNLELFKVDLSQIVSKYIGETEKNLNEIFNEAKISNAILFFDEADSLFGKRSEVNSANDRYSNLETSYLLQKIEEYDGVSILATNYMKNIDDAFMRRMKYIISFPFPNAQIRKKIWEVTIPKRAPADNDIDFDFLAETFELSGGNIKNILVYSAFLSAAEESKINMRYILKAVRYEMQKIGKLVLSQDLKQYRHLLNE